MVRVVSQQATPNQPEHDVHEYLSMRFLARWQGRRKLWLGRQARALRRPKLRWPCGRLAAAAAAPPHCPCSPVGKAKRALLQFGVEPTIRRATVEAGGVDSRKQDCQSRLICSSRQCQCCARLRCAGRRQAGRWWLGPGGGPSSQVYVRADGRRALVDHNDDDSGGGQHIHRNERCWHGERFTKTRAAACSVVKHQRTT